MTVGILAMIYVDWARPWKRDQLAEMKWEARKLELENMILEARTQKARKAYSEEEAAAHEKYASRNVELKELGKKLVKARGAFYAADYDYKAQKQFTGKAIYEREHAHADQRAEYGRRLAAERDKEARLKEQVNQANGRLNDLVAEEKALRSELDAIVDKMRKNPELKKMQLMAAARDKKRGYNPLRDVPLLDFLAPPTKVEQVVLENLVDNYEFSLPKKVDRCGTCHVGVMRLGFEATKWPLEALDMEAGAAKSEMLEQGVYEFVFTLLESVWPKTPPHSKFKHENDVLRTLAIHHETLMMLFVSYDPEDGAIATWDKGPRKGRKIWKRYRFSERSGRWLSGMPKGTTIKDYPETGTSLLEYYYGLLQRMDKHWRSHPFIKDMVGSTSPHPYDKVGCTVCHNGRGWSTDFGFAYHVPDRDPIDNWMTVARAEEQHLHLPESTDQTLDEVMLTGAFNAIEQAAWDAGPEAIKAKVAAAEARVKSLAGGTDNPAQIAAQHELKLAQAEQVALASAQSKAADLRVGWVTDNKTGHRWHDELDWTHRKLHHWDWPQLPKMLVQASCLKCHKEGLYSTAEPEYATVHLGKPKPGVPSLKPTRAHFKAFNDDPEGDYAGRMFVPKDEESYRPESLEAGMDAFLRFGCYGCHKLDPTVYSFMNHQRDKVAPQLNDIVSKTDKPWTRKWVRNPKDFRPGTRMPRFFGLSNNSRDFEYRYADGDGNTVEVDAEAWSNAEIYAIVEWMFDESGKNGTFKAPAVDLSKGDKKRGERILVAFGGKEDRAPKACVACHDVPITTPELQLKVAELKKWESPTTDAKVGWGHRMSRRQGPNLAGLGSKLKPEWLVAWLKNPRSYWHDSNMPDLRLTDQEALDVAAYLLSLRNDGFDKLADVPADMALLTRIAQELKVGEQREPTDAALGLVERMSERERVLYVGGSLFKNYGCFGCHSVEEYETTSPIGTELTSWGSKLIDRLAFNHVPMEKTRFDFAYTKLMNPRVYDLGTVAADRPFERLKMPRFGFSSQEAKDLSVFLVALVEDPIPEPARFHADARQQEIIEGRHLVRRYNCQGCHVIEGKGGDVWPAISEEKWRPPDLLGQGIKTNPQWLFHFMKEPAFVAIDGVADSDRVRPWHAIRMPTFELSDDEARKIVRYFAALSEAPNDFESVEPDSLVGADARFAQEQTREIKDLNDPEGKKKLRFQVGDRLAETEILFRALECKKCHSTEAELENAAPNFRHTRGGRLRPAWIRKWLWNPSKLQPGTAMPTFFANEKGPKTDFKAFHGGIPDDQIRALRDYIRWHYDDNK
jgi:cytochrome c2